MEPLHVVAVLFASLFLLALPVALILWMLRRPSRCRLDLLLKAAILVLYALGLAWEGVWSLFSVYAGWAVQAALLGAAILGVRRQYGGLPAYAPRPAWGWVKRALCMAAVLWLGADAVTDLRGRCYQEAALDLAYPLKEGVVAHGGSTEAINYHCADTTAQQYALDIEKLYPWGSRAKGLFPKAPADYAIYGDTVFSPCAGRVALVHDGHDNTGIGGRDSVHPAGNAIALEYRNHLIVFAHLQKHSIRVRPGETVAVGQPLAQVGNSGNTTEPHLHLHAVTGRDTAGILRGNGIPMTFNGRFLVRNNRIRLRDFRNALAAKQAVAETWSALRGGLALAGDVLQAVKRLHADY